MRAKRTHATTSTHQIWDNLRNAQRGLRVWCARWLHPADPPRVFQNSAATKALRWLKLWLASRIPAILVLGCLMVLVACLMFAVIGPFTAAVEAGLADGTPLTYCAINVTLPSSTGYQQLQLANVGHPVGADCWEVGTAGGRGRTCKVSGACHPPRVLGS
jgi:hypothetical protein